MTTNMKRDLHADLAICDAATPGPWLVDSPSNQVRQPNGSKRRRITTPPDASGIKDAAFIAAARQGWPEAIRRALAAEAENERLRKALVSTARRLNFIETWRYDERIDAYNYTREEHEMLIETAREALRK